MGYIISYRESHEGFPGSPSQKDSGIVTLRQVGYHWVTGSSF